MKVVTAAQMRELEQEAGRMGLTTAMLMERAGLSVAQEVRRWEGGIAGRRVLVLVGPGNNGGDGLAAARHLHDWGARVSLYLLAPRNQQDPSLSPLLQRGIEAVEAAQDPHYEHLTRLLDRAEVVLDALLGTGRSRPLEGPYRESLERVHAAKRQRPRLSLIALDLPSGLDPDSGAMDPACFPADLTVTLGYPKVGILTIPGAEAVGQLVTVDIGIPPQLAESLSLEQITSHQVARLLPQRPVDANKGTFGRALVVAGSMNYVGSAALACWGAQRAGAGLVTLATPESLLPIYAAKLTESTFLPLPETEAGTLGQQATQPILEAVSRYDALLVGCGIGQHPASGAFLKGILLSGKLPPDQKLVLDADGLNLLATIPEWWRSFPQEAVLTPHPGEMARLLGCSVLEVQAHRLERAQEAAKQWRKIVVLKGAYTVVAAPDGRTRLSASANPLLASAGTGDVLAGVILGLLAQGLSPFDAASCGVYLHAKAGESLRAALGSAGLLATDLLPQIPAAMRQLRTLEGV